MYEVSEIQAPVTAAPTVESGKVASRKRRKAAAPGSYLIEKQVAQLQEAAGKSGRWGHRDRTLVMMLFRHGLRSEEVVRLRWSQVHLDGTAPKLRVQRVKGGNDATHPLKGMQIRALRQLRRDWPDSPYVFVTERGDQMSTSNVRKILARVGRAAMFPFAVHPHQLRHACGHYLAERGADTRAIQDYLGHVNITHTVRYTQGTSARFESFFPD